MDAIEEALSTLSGMTPDDLRAKVADPTRVRSPWLNGLKTFAVKYR